MEILLDSTGEKSIALQSGKRVWQFPTSKRDSGASLIRKLTKLKISKNDELKVVVGPGNFTAVRTVCLIGNAIKFLTGCRVLAKKKSDPAFHMVENLQPFYATEPAITIAKTHLRKTSVSCATFIKLKSLKK